MADDEKVASNANKQLEPMTGSPMPAQDPESKEKKYPYPKSIAFIVSNEFCERFSFYGMRTILSLYLSEKLRYSDNDSVVIYHVFIMFVYFFPIFGAMIADSWLGRFRTIVYLSIVYAFGNIVVSLTAMPPLHIPDRAFTIVGLLLVAIGTGGIKPCVSSFGGDQFKLPQQEKQLATFFSLFYFAINAGSFISTFITPILRYDVHCFGDKDCYSLAFGVPGILMIVSIFIFIAGKPLYIIKNPSGNVLMNVCKCMMHACSRKRQIKKQEKKDHWLDYADDKYSQTEINDIKAALKVLLLFVPLPVFWALFDQQGSRWTFQATRMNGQMGSFIMKPDQMQVVNPLLILLFIPLFEVAIYPCLNWCKIIRKPLHKMIIGGLLAALAFIISGILELQLEPTYPVLPKMGNGHLRLYNGMNGCVNVTYDSNPYFIENLGFHENKDIEVNEFKNIPYTLSVVNCDDPSNEIESKKGVFLIEESKAISFFLFDSSKDMYRFEDDSDKSSKGLPAVRVLRSYNTTKTMQFIDRNSKTVIDIESDNNERIDLDPTTYDLKLGEDEPFDEKTMQLGVVYTMIINEKDAKIAYSFLQIAPPNSIHMMWLMIQYIIITMGEVMFSVTGLEFAFTQAPLSMKSVLTAGWLLTVAFGNLIVVIIAETKAFNSQASEFFLFAGLMIVDMLIFGVMALRYKYVDSVNGSDSLQEKNELPMMTVPAIKGFDNLAMTADEKEK